MKTNKILTSILFLFIISKISSQTLINGDFEINSTSVCHKNLNDDDYNNLMASSYGFGNNFHSGIDIQTTDCGSETPIINLWCIGLTKNGIGSEGSVGVSDQVALKIDMPLTTDQLYQLSYFDLPSSKYNNLITPIEIGLSNDSSDFGVLIYTSIPVENTWTKRIFTFTAPSSGSYITIRNDLDGNSDVGAVLGFNFVDNFELSNITTATTDLKNHTTKVYPNPAKSVIILESNFPVSLINIYNIAGNRILSKTFANRHKMPLNISDLNPGYYIIETKGNKISEINRTKLLVVPESH